MMMRLALALASLTVGCAPALRYPAPTDLAVAQARFPSATLAELEEGRGIYVSHCGSCHALRLPEERPPEAWESILGPMGKEAKLDERERELVRRFVVTLSAAGRT
jgi:mono/diheme cytochrome c family protein